MQPGYQGFLSTGNIPPGRKRNQFFSSSLGEKEKDKIKVCLKMIAFGMGNTLLTFVNKHYEWQTAGSKLIASRVT
jgi:hypothetical protein